MLEELTEELRQSEKTAYEKLIRLMSHEVNNTVGAANSLLHSCLHYTSQIAAHDQADFETAINVVITRTNQLGAFMKSFAEVVKLPALKLQHYEMQQLLTDIAHLLRAEIERRKIQLVWEVQLSLGKIALDRVQMEQALLNIFKNALEAIDTDGQITIRTGRQNNRHYVSIIDTGCGLSAEVREHLFTPFFSTKEQGQGIGLTMVQEILDAHQFDFSLESTPQQNTTFTIWFDQ